MFSNTNSLFTFYNAHAILTFIDVFARFGVLVEGLITYKCEQEDSIWPIFLVSITRKSFVNFSFAHLPIYFFLNVKAIILFFPYQFKNKLLHQILIALTFYLFNLASWVLTNQKRECCIELPTVILNRELIILKISNPISCSHYGSYTYIVHFFIFHGCQYELWTISVRVD